MKHLKTLLTTIVVLLCSVTMNAHDFEADGIYYNITSATDLTVAVTYKGSDHSSAVYSGDIVIPSSVSYNGNTYSVTSIGDYAFYGCSGLTNVSIPNSVTIIGDYAFYGCSGLTNVSIPNSVTRIGQYAFPSNVISTENNIQYVDTWAIGVVDKKQISYTLRTGTLGLAHGALSQCINMQSVELPNSLKYIDYMSFYGCCDLNGINLPSSVTNIEYGAFEGCTSLSSITIPLSVTNIEERTFSSCTSLSSITIPSSVTNIGDNAFYNCYSLANVTINSNSFISKDFIRDEYSGLPLPSCLKYIFGTQVKEYTIGGNVKRIGNNAFFYCDSLTTVKITSDLDSIGRTAFEGCTSLSSIIIPLSVTNIEYGAFKDCTSLSSITIPLSVTNIEERTFSSCTSLSSITIPSSVTNIGDNAFYNCYSLANVTINSNSFISKDFLCGYGENRCLKDIFGTQVKEYTIGGNVEKIGDNAFYECDSLTTVKITSDLDGIGSYVFSNCLKLEDINIPDNVKYIGSNAFYGCTSLASISIPSSVTNIGNYAFGGCTNLSSIIIPTSVTNIGSNTFDGCTSLSSITIPTSVTNIGDYAFRGCTSLASITIPTSVTNIGSNTFDGCTSLSSITIPSSVTNIASTAFSGCNSLTNVTINSNSFISKDFSQREFSEQSCLKYIFGTQVKEYTIGGNVEKIGDYAFYECDSLTTVKITSDLDSIGGSAFSNCINLTSITIPTSVTNIGSNTFYGCTNLASITIPSSIINIENDAFRGCTSMSSITIPENVVSIGFCAFYNCGNLTNATINSNSFISQKFSSYNGLKYIFGTQVKEYTIGGNVEKIGDYAFYACDSLTTVRITSDLDSIGSSVFYNCVKLEDINIPDNVKYIGSNTFEGCTSLPVESNIRYAGTWAIGVTDQTLPRYILRSNTRGLLGTFSGCSLMTRVTLPDSLRNIGDNAFNGCSSIKNLTLPSRVNYIGSSAFSGCTSLASLTIPDGVTAIGRSTFYGCSALTSMIIPDNVESLGASLFYNCHNLSSVTLPKGLTKVENSTFYGCNLSDFEMPESVTSIGTYAFYDNPLSAIVIPSTVTSIGDYAFSNCYNLDTVTVNSADIMANGKFSKVFGENITNYNIGGNIKELADFAFFNYQKIKKITLPESLETIGESAFESCVNLDSVTLPKNVANIGAYAFASCTALKSVVSNNPVPPVCGEEAFYEVETANCSLEVPDSVVSLYSETAPWSDFNIVGVVMPTAMALVDGEVYDNKKELAMDSITYTRTFNNTNWQALYVPFAMNYEDWSADFDVAKINDIHQFDINGDGDFSDEGVDKTIMEMLIVNSGSLKPNHPYLIRAKAKGQKTITIKDAVLMPAQSKSIDCSSVEQKYVFTGTYNVIDGETMVAGKYYAMSGGSVKYTSSTANSLKPFRWYMQIQNRDGQVIQDVSEVKVVVRGEDDRDATGIDEIDTEENIYTIYSVDGRAIRCIKATTIEEATQGIASGMYIINGKKHFVK